MAIIDSYSESNHQVGNIWEVDSSAWLELGQVFESTGGVLTSAKFYLKRHASSTGSAFAKLYAITGTPGTDAEPTGSALATSNALDVSSISSSSYELIEFNFTDNYTMVNGTHYAIMFAYSATANPIEVAVDGTAPSHNGNGATLFGSEFDGDPFIDVCFYVYGDLPEPFPVDADYSKFPKYKLRRT